MTDNDAKPASRKPSFFKVLFPGFSSQLKLPRAFVRKHITREELKAGSATLSCPNGKLLNVSLQNDQHDTYLWGDEWCACAQALDLKVGYLLIFSYEVNMLFSFKVFDLSSCEKSYPPLPVCAETNAAKGTNTCKIHRFKIVYQRWGPIVSYCKDCKCSRFESRLAPYNLSRAYMRITGTFLKLAGMPGDQEKLTLIGCKGQSWTVGLHFEVRGTEKYAFIRKGFRHFLNDNRLEEGDTCIFDLEAGKKDIMHVQILRTECRVA